MIDQPCEMDLARTACGCAEHILTHYLRVPVIKARMTLATRGDFDLAVLRLASDLQARAEKSEKAALEAALRTLDVDWTSTSLQHRRELISRAVEAAQIQLDVIHHALPRVFVQAARRVVEAAKADAREWQGLSVSKKFTALDKRMMQFMTRSETLLIRDRFGKRIDAFNATARQVVANGMAAGLGRDAIGAELATATSGWAARGEAYWQVVAGAFVGRGRSYAQMGAYHEAGLSHYRVVAVMDEQTSDVCRAMDGRVLSVDAALDAFGQAEKSTDPAAFKAINPWPSPADLRSGAADKLSFPPYHGLCRTHTVGIA